MRLLTTSSFLVSQLYTYLNFRVRREAEATAMYVLKKGLITEAGDRKQKKPYELLGYLCQKSFTTGFTLWEFMEFIWD